MNNPTFEQLLWEERVILAAIELVHAYGLHLPVPQWPACRKEAKREETELLTLAERAPMYTIFSDEARPSRERLIKIVLEWAMERKECVSTSMSFELCTFALRIAVDNYEREHPIPIRGQFDEQFRT